MIWMTYVSKNLDKKVIFRDCEQFSSSIYKIGLHKAINLNRL